MRWPEMDSSREDVKNSRATTKPVNTTNWLYVRASDLGIVEIFPFNVNIWYINELFPNERAHIRQLNTTVLGTTKLLGSTAGPMVTSAYVSIRASPLTPQGTVTQMPAHKPSSSHWSHISETGFSVIEWFSYKTSSPWKFTLLELSQQTARLAHRPYIYHTALKTFSLSHKTQFNIPEKRKALNIQSVFSLKSLLCLKN